MTSIKLRHQPARFTKLDSAWSWANSATKDCWTVIHGDDSRFWVVCLSDASRLVKAGYEYAPEVF